MIRRVVAIWSASRVGVAAGVLLLAPFSSAALAASAWPAEVAAVYRVKMAGFEMGKFHYRSDIDKTSYRLSGHLKLSWGFGMFNWRSSISSSGSLAGNSVQPAAYAFDFDANKKSG